MVGVGAPPITIPVPIPVSTPTPVPVSNPVTTTVVFPANVAYGNVLIFIGSPVIYLVESDGLHPFTEYPGYQSYIASSKELLMHMAVNSNGVTLVAESAEAYLGIEQGSNTNPTPSVPVVTSSYKNNTIVNDHGTIYLIEENY